jgi:sulfoacetaldehyde dehydrogenase
MARAITEEEKASAQTLLQRARAAMVTVNDYDQATVDRLCQAIAWARRMNRRGRLTA